MEINCNGNQARIALLQGEGFFIKSSFLTGVPQYDWTFPPPHPWGSPFVRLYHHCWILKQVEAKETARELQIQGNRSRGNFAILNLAKGERYYVAVRYLAGFSCNLISIHTRIKFMPSFWLLREHFFPIFEGPGSILLYGGSSLEVSNQREFLPSRIAAFSADKAFRPIAPQPQKMTSQFINLLFSKEVIWQFSEPGGVLAETYNEFETPERQNFLRKFLKHLFSFFKL